jgi:anti-anti-sigma factor
MAVSSNDRAFHFEDRGTHSIIVFRPALNDEWTRVHEYGDLMAQCVRDASSRRLLLDLGELDLCGSAVVAVMVNLWKEVRRRGGVLAVYCPSPVLRQTLAVSRLTDLWEIRETRDEAEKALMGTYTDSQTRDRTGLGWLALLGVLALAAMTALFMVSATLAVPAIACGAVGSVSLLSALFVWLEVPRSVHFARAWAVLVIGVALLALGFTLGKGALAVGYRIAIASALLATAGLGWLVWRALRSREAPSD